MCSPNPKGLNIFMTKETEDILKLDYREEKDKSKPMSSQNWRNTKLDSSQEKREI